ncbi:MAG: helix-turn-helix domain-containing protein [Candidatus Omnitrophota bacterium]
MGVIYKLKPEVREFILHQRAHDPHLGCRKLAIALREQFHLTVSKSSINAVLKEEGLSMPVGRRGKKKNIIKELGAIFLKAMDCLIGGSCYISEDIKKTVKPQIPELLQKTEAAIFNSLDLDAQIKTLFNQKITSKQLSLYLFALQDVKDLPMRVSALVSNLIQKVHCIKIDMNDSSQYYIDGQLHNIWPSSKIPDIFFTTIYDAERYVNNFLYKDIPLVLFQAAGYDKPAKEFFDFLFNISSAGKGINKIALYGPERKEIGNFSCNKEINHCLVFGLWPWQFTECRNIIEKTDFQPFYFEPLKLNYYLAEIEVELTQPDTDKKVMLRGCAVKNKPDGNVNLYILYHWLDKQMDRNKLFEVYLSHWPNLEGSFRDFTAKIEADVYSGSQKTALNLENVNFDKSGPDGMNKLFDNYLRLLDLYFQSYFLPAGSKIRDLSSMKKLFYGLKGKITIQKNYLIVTFYPPANSSVLKDLKYACRRINERRINLFHERKFLCFVEA